MKALYTLRKNFVKYKGYLLGGVLFIVLSNLFAVFIPPIVREAIDVFVAESQGAPTDSIFSPYIGGYKSLIAKALFFGGLIVASAMLKGLFMFFMRQTIIVMSRYIEYDLKNEIFQHYQRLGQRFYSKNYTGDLMNRISEDVSRVRDFVGPAVMYAINLFFMITMVVSIMFYVNAEITVFVLLPLPVLALTIYLVSDTMNRRSDIIQKRLSGLTSFAQESFAGIHVLKSFAVERIFQKEFADLTEDYKETNMSLVRVNAWFMPAVIGLVGLSVLITVYTGGMAAISGKFTVGNIAEYVIYVYMLTWPVASLGYITSLVQRAAASMKRINEFLLEKPQEMGGSMQLTELKEGIRFENVSFSYETDGPFVLKDIDFFIPAGTKFGIIGTTGSGKSTIAKLMLGVYRPTSGRILIDGVDMREYDLKSVRDMIGYVAQDIFLFSDSIRNNILFGTHDPEHESRLDDVLAMAALDTEVEEFPDKLETILGERGITLSGGQKQRTAIARALIKSPSIVVMDDGLSAVDTKTEVKIKRALTQLDQRTTFINISHRISSLQDAEKIIFMDAGEVVESGDHQSLMQQNGAYAELYVRQLEQAESGQV